MTKADFCGLTARVGAFRLPGKAEARSAISFGKSKDEDVVGLIVVKKYARAIEVKCSSRASANPSLRMQLADVLIMADKKTKAVRFPPLADQYAQDGFAAKAVSVLKKVQKVDPGRRDVEERLARQIEERQREAVSPPRWGDPRDGGDWLRRGPLSLHEGPSLEIGFAMAPISAPVEPPAPEARAPLPPRVPEPLPSTPLSPDQTLPFDFLRALPGRCPSPRRRPRRPWTARSRTMTFSTRATPTRRRRSR